ncbi:MAG: N-acetylneuraminate synthase [Candidatus Omnitrophica bacterium]|nr:N-acetylneuraminate synthase [Candidatus Omnitrophota bacterium]
MTLGTRGIGEGHPCFIIAEAGVNHNGELALARRLVEEAAGAGADAVKFQTFKAEQLATREAPKAPYQQQATDAAESQLEMLRRLELSRDAHRQLFADCQARGILFLSSPFDEESADFLEELGVAAFKLPSGELTNLPLLAHVARKRKPIIASTGMASLEEVAAALEVIRGAGNQRVALLHCLSNYPADPAEVNLRAIHTMRVACGTPVGFSDHTEGPEVALAAVALGACIIEKHLTLDRRLPGPDHRASIEPETFRALVRSVRIVESSLGHGRKEPSRSERDTAAAVRKSVVAAQDIRRGSRVTEACLAVKRPGTGLPPSVCSRFVGLVAKQDIAAGSVLTWDLFL